VSSVTLLVMVTGLALLLTTTVLLRERTTVVDTAVAYWRAGDVAG